MTGPPWPDPLTLDPDSLASTVLRRLVAEVQQEAREDTGTVHGRYDRIHNRHNRGPNPRPRLGPDDAQEPAP
jgi:hypothetical protein